MRSLQKYSSKSLFFFHIHILQIYTAVSYLNSTETTKTKFTEKLQKDDFVKKRMLDKVNIVTKAVLNSWKSNKRHKPRNSMSVNKIC